MEPSGHLQQTPSWGHCQAYAQHSKGWALGQYPDREWRVPYRAWPAVPRAPFPRARQLARLFGFCRVDSQVSGSPSVPAEKGVWLGRLPPPCLPPWCWQSFLPRDQALLDFLCFFLLACPQTLSPANFSRNSYNFEVPATSDLFTLMVLKPDLFLTKPSSKIRFVPGRLRTQVLKLN